MINMIQKMHKNIVQIMVVLAVVLFGYILIAAPMTASAATKDIACDGLDEALGDGACDDGAGGDEINSTIVTVIDLLSVIVAVISVIMIIIGGFRYVTSGGEPGSTKSGRDTVIYALVGLIIVALAQTLVKFVVTRITSGNSSGNANPPQTT